MTPQIGEVWHVRHSRKGDLVLRLTGESDEWLHTEIVEGTVKWLSQSNRTLQREQGLGTAGEPLTVRRKLVKFLSRVE